MCKFLRNSGMKDFCIWSFEVERENRPTVASNVKIDNENEPLSKF